MKRLFLGMMIFGGATLLGGCPIYPDQRSYQVCGECCSSADCSPGFACTTEGQCTSEGSAVDASTSACGSCPFGTVCTLSGGTLQCLAPGAEEPDSSVGSGDTGALPFADAGAPPSGSEDGGPATDAGPDAKGTDGGPGITCNADAQCSGSGSKCIDGLCTAQNQLCSDGTQCVVAGESCVDGVCVPACGASGPPCPAGYACDFNRDVCDVNPSPCSQSSQCQGGAICVETRCVAPCGATEAGAQCSSGQVCVNGGCIPDEQAHVVAGPSGTECNAAAGKYCSGALLCIDGNCK